MEIPLPLLIEVLSDTEAILTKKPLFVIIDHAQSRGFSKEDPATILKVYTERLEADMVMWSITSQGQEASGYMCYFDGSEGLCEEVKNGSLKLTES